MYTDSDDPAASLCDWLEGLSFKRMRRRKGRGLSWEEGHGSVIMAGCMKFINALICSSDKLIALTLLLSCLLQASHQVTGKKQSYEEIIVFNR